MNTLAFPPRRAFPVAARLASIAAGVSLLSIAAHAQNAAPAVAESGWTYTVESLATGVNNGYQLALDPVNRQVYFSDAQWRVEARAPDGTISVTRTATGKLVVFDAATRNVTAIHSYLGLTRNDGNGTDGDPFDWTGAPADAASLASTRSTFSPYGIAVDGTTTNAAGEVDPTIITTTARGRVESVGFGGHVVIYNASQGAPTDDDRLWLFDDGTPIFDGIRRVAVNTATHQAFVTNFAGVRSEEGGNPGFVAVIDLLTREVIARVEIPGGAIGVTVDEENNLIYVGTLVGTGLYVIDGDALDTSDPQNLTINAGALTELAAVVGENARPTYNAELERVYVSAYAEVGTITVVDADPDSVAYGTILDTIETGPTNMVEVDAERGLLFSANLGAREVVVFDTEDHDELLRLPTTGNALNIGIDPVTHDVWVSNFARTSFVDIFTLVEPQ